MKTRALVLLGVFAILVAGFSSPAMGAEEVKYKVKIVAPPPLKRPPVKISRDLLPKGAKGSFPTFDGEAAHVNMPPGYRRKAEPGEMKVLIETYLRAIGWKRKPDDVKYIDTVELPVANKQFVAKEIERLSAQSRQRQQKRFRKLNKATEASLKEDETFLMNQAGQRTKMFRFSQFYKGTPLYNADLTILVTADKKVTALIGRVFDLVNVDNSSKLDAEKALAAAQKFVKEYTKVAPEPRPQPKLFVLPYGKVFRYAWMMDIMAEGPYRIWVDAENGGVLWVEPLFHFADGRGLVFDPDPATGTQEFSFGIDAASSGQYTLRFSGELDVDNTGADGVCTGDVTITDDGSGTANFNVSPINGTVIERTSDTNYNCRFQDVNAFGWIGHEVKLYELLGSQPFPSVTVTVNEISPCGYNSNNACSGGSYLEFGIGQATISSSTSWCTDAFNNALEGPTMSHELGHSLNRYQYSSSLATPVTMPRFINEGMADYWAYAMHNTDTLGGWIRHNCTTISQGGWRPRQAEALDVFPDHRTLATGDYADGQIASWALLSARRELLEASSLGNLSLYIQLLKAMTTAGSGAASSSDKERHDTVINLLEEVVSQYKDSWWVHKVLAGFAGAGFLIAERDAVIDIGDDYLDRNDTAGPTFTVWTGRDYTFSAGGSVNTTSMPCNTRFSVEVANDSGFTTNLRSSGFLSGISSGAGSPGCRATWTLPTTDWNALKGGDTMYYRLTTTDDAGENERTSGNPGGFFSSNVPTPRAIINDSGECECTCGCSMVSASAPAVLGGLTLVPIVFAFVLRRRFRKEK